LKYAKQFHPERNTAIDYERQRESDTIKVSAPPEQREGLQHMARHMNQTKSSPMLEKNIPTLKRHVCRKVLKTAQGQ
jgi:hypothetical protein